MNIDNIQGYADLPDHLKDSSNDFIQSILLNEFDNDENVEIARVREYCDGVEVTFRKDNEEYSFCNVTRSFFEGV